MAPAAHITSAYSRTFSFIICWVSSPRIGTKSRTLQHAAPPARTEGWGLISPSPQLRIHGATDSSDDVRYGFNIRRAGMKVHNASPQYVVVVDDGVRNKGFAAALQPIEQFAIE